jgi:hypothetical protein
MKRKTKKNITNSNQLNDKDMKKTITIIAILAIALTAANTAFARGGSSGGRSGGGFRSSAPRVSSPTPRPTVAPTPVSRPTVAPTPVSTKPTTAQKTAYANSLKTNKAVTPTKKTTSGKTLSTKSKTIGSGYNPKFRNGSTYPAGSTVYYPQRDFLDYLPWIFLFTMDSHRQAVVYPPATTGTSTAAVAPIETEEEGVDTMYLINWIVMILLTGGIIGGIVYYINKKTK